MMFIGLLDTRVHASWSNCLRRVVMLSCSGLSGFAALAVSKGENCSSGMRAVELPDGVAGRSLRRGTGARRSFRCWLIAERAMVLCGESGAVVFGGQLDVEPFTDGLERMGCTKTHGHPQSRKPVARDRLILEVMPPASQAKKRPPCPSLCLLLGLPARGGRGDGLEGERGLVSPSKVGTFCRR